ncbi:MAG TPA: integrin alpha, partial [Anaerolineae bacterium]|nr:integrin alpha [Anaerolineae bacterium]
MSQKTVLSWILNLALLFAPTRVTSRNLTATVSPPSQTAINIPEMDTTLPNTLTDLPNTDENWWAAVQENIRQSEYHVTWQKQTYLADLPAAYQAPNRAHNLRTYFTPQGVRVIPRVFEGETPPWEWGLVLHGYGAPDAVQPVVEATLTAEGHRLEYRRGPITEWYVNDERGLEQGFTLAASPDSPDGAVMLVLTWTGTLRPAMSADEQALEWTTPGGVRVLRYDSLLAYDANGRDLPIHIQLDPDNAAIQLIVEAAGAVYPITIDPLATTPDWSAESDQADANFGYAVGTAGDVNGDGYSDVIVGAPFYDNGQTNEGWAFVYHGSASGLSAAAAWTAESDQNGACFGQSV